MEFLAAFQKPLLNESY